MKTCDQESLSQAKGSWINFIRIRLLEPIEDENPGKPRDFVDTRGAGEHEPVKSDFDASAKQASKILTARMMDMSIGTFNNRNR